MIVTGSDRPGRTAPRVREHLATLLACTVLLACAALLAGCALVDDARREVGPGTGSEPGAAASPGASTGPTASRSPAAGDPPPQPGGADGSGPPDRCPPSGMLVRPGVVDAAMGLRAVRIELVNCGSAPFTVNGYPALRVLDDARTPLPVTIVNGSTAVASIDNFDTPAAPVTAAPGERLVAGLVWRNTVTDTTVGPVDGTYLEVVPVPGQPPQTVSLDGGIDIGTTGRLGVTAWGTARR